MDQVPIIDCTSLFDSSFSSSQPSSTISAIHNAFSTWGIFILTGTNSIPPDLTDALREALHKFFSLPLEKKEKIHLRHGGWAWRGYMPFGGEASKGVLDQKEGFYGGPELGDEDDHPLKGMPTYGKNQFPDEDVPELRNAVLQYTQKATELGLTISDAMSIALGFDKSDIRLKVLDPDPVQLFRSFKYIGKEDPQNNNNGIGEHSDFGFLTILSQDSPGLQVLSPTNQWTDVQVVPNSFVINVGDILDRLTCGRYIAPLHRVVLGPHTTERLSIPFFFDPAWTAKMQPFSPSFQSTSDMSDALIRWKQRSTFNNLEGIWGQYLGVKVGKVFPDLVLPEFPAVSRASGRHLLEVEK